MKKIIILGVLICSISVILFSCSKKDDDKAVTGTEVETTTTAAGRITVGSISMSGTYVGPCDTACISAVVHAGVPSDTCGPKCIIGDR